MSVQAPNAVWWHAVEQAHKGDARYLLELLLRPAVESGRGDPLEFTALPDDAALRHAIVDMLVFGPWRTAESATNLDDLMTRVYSGGKPAVSEFEVSSAAAAVQLGAGSIDDMAESLGIQPETLGRRIAKRKKR